MIVRLDLLRHGETELGGGLRGSATVTLLQCFQAPLQFFHGGLGLGQRRRRQRTGQRPGQPETRPPAGTTPLARWSLLHELSPSSWPHGR